MSLCIPWRHTKGVNVYLHLFLVMALDGDEWSALCFSHFMPGKTVPSILDWRLGHPQSQCGHFEEEKNLLSCQDLNPRLSSLWSCYTTSYAITLPVFLTITSFLVKGSVNLPLVHCVLCKMSLCLMDASYRGSFCRWSSLILWGEITFTYSNIS